MHSERAEIQTKGEKHTPPIWLFWRARRYVVVLFLFFGFASGNAFRSIMSIAIIAMTQYTDITLDNGTIIMTKEFKWNSVEQGYILSSFFYGFVVAHLVGGSLAIRIPAKLIWTVRIGGASVLTFLTPWLAQLNFGWFLAIRILTGTFEGLTTPCTVQLWANWTPPDERNRLVMASYSGTYLGTVLTLALAPLVSSAWGWQGIFYTFGGAGIVWTISWMCLISNSPSRDPRISPDELKYINDSLQTVNVTEKVKTPWLSIFTSIPAYALFVLGISENWGAYTLLTQLPRFVRYVLNFDLSQAGFLSSLPYVMLFIMFQVHGHITDYVLKKKWLSKTQMRKSFAGLGLLFQMAFLILAGHWLSPAGSIFSFLVASSMSAFVSGTGTVNSIDLSPRFGSIILGVVGVLASIPSIVVPIVTGYVVTDEGNVEQWRIMFYIAAGFYLVGCITYVLFGSGDEQKWNNPENNNLPSNINESVKKV